MTALPLDIVGGATFGRYNKISQANTYNMFVADNALVPYPGYKSVKATPGVESRGLFYSPVNNVMIHVIDNTVYQVDTKLNYEIIGNLETSTGIVYMTSNNAIPSQIMICDLSNLYIYVFGVSFGPVNLNGSFLPSYIDFQDSYFLSCDRRNNLFYLSHPGEGNNWVTPDPTSGVTYQGAFESKPDTVQAIVAFNRIVLVMGNNGTEIWRDVGNALFAYQRDNYYTIDYGVVSVPTIAEGFGYVVWLAKNEYSSPVIMMTQGGQPQPISTDGINFILDRITNPESSSGFIFQNSTHVFYQITFYEDNITLVYDFTTSLFFTLTDQNMNYHIAKRFCHFNGTNYFVAYGNDNSGNVHLYEMNTKYTTYDGYTVPRYRICSPKRQSSTDQFVIRVVSVTMEQGVSTKKQTVGLSMCKNGGLAFGNIVSKTLNKQGYGKNKIQWYQMGSANDVSFKFQFWSGDPEQYQANQPYNGPDGSLIDDGNLNERFVIIGAEVEIDS